MIISDNKSVINDLILIPKFDIFLDESKAEVQEKAAVYALYKVAGNNNLFN